MSDEKQKVPFDPGYSELTTGFPTDVNKYLDEISSLKQNHQKKFAFNGFETRILPLIKNSAAFYLGCVLWGSYLALIYKNDPREIEGNHLLSLSEEEKNDYAENEPVDFILKFLERFEKSAKYYLNRASKMSSEYRKYFETYKKFVELNNHFKTLKYTNEINLPEEVSHLEDFDPQKLDKIKDKIYEIILSGKIETLLESEFFKDL